MNDINSRKTPINIESFLKMRRNASSVNREITTKPVSSYKVKQDAYTPTKTKSKSKLAKYGIVAGALLVAFGALSIFRKGKLKQASQILEKVDTAWSIESFGKTTIEGMKKSFIRNFIEPLKKGEVPKNGFLVEGPESKGKTEFFNWGIEELRKIGVEIIDSTDSKLGHSTKHSIREILNLVHSDTVNQFKKDKKYRLFIVRGMEKIENYYKSTKTLKGSTHDSARNNGVILAYDCLNTSNLDPAVTRLGRIDDHYIPAPLAEEGMEKWKEFLEFAKPSLVPRWAKKNVEEAKEIFAQQGTKVMEEMKPYLDYAAPYKIPEIKADISLWEKYITQSTKELSRKQQYGEFTTVVEVSSNDYLYNKISENKYKKIMDMVIENLPEESKAGMKKYQEVCLQQRL